MITSAAPHVWAEGDRSRTNSENHISSSTDRILMSDVDFKSARPLVKVADNSGTSADHIEMASLFGRNSDSKIDKLESVGMKYYNNQDPKVFEVKSGRFTGMQVPEALRCGIFQSNIALEAGIIKPGEVTVRAIEFGNLMKAKGYQEEKFVPGKSYPNGTVIVGAGGGAGNEFNHVGLVLNDKLLHTHAGHINYESIGNKFYKGAYYSMKVFIPPGKRTQA